MDKNGNTTGPVLLRNVALLESSNYNVFSSSKLLNSRWKMHDDASTFVMINRSKVLTFDLAIKTTKGALFCAQFKRSSAAVAGANRELAKSMSIDNAHQLFGHANEEATQAMASRLG